MRGMSKPGNWVHLGKHSRDNPPGARAHAGDSWVMQAEQRQLSDKKRKAQHKSGFAQHRRALAQHKPVVVKVFEYTDERGVRYTIWQ